jgi:hypothetical protein
MRLPDGSVRDQPLVCQSRDSAVGPTADTTYTGLDGPPTAPRNPAAEDPLRWEAFFNYAQAFTYPLQPTPAGAARAVVPRDQLGGFLSNVDNAYAFAMGSRGIGPVLVLRGRASRTPQTLDGRPVMGSGDVRYWSLCENEVASQRVVDCLYDEQARIDSRGWFTIAVSTPASRPRNARAECGVGWLAWGPQPDAFVILRHMLPSPAFAQAIQRVARAGTERDVVGDYLPVGRHTSVADFEALGCGGASGSGTSRGAEPVSGSGSARIAFPPARTVARCGARRSLTIRLPRRRGLRLERADVYLNGRRVRRVTGRALHRAVRLARLPRGAYTVRVVVRARVGSRRVVLRGTRRYPACR